MFPALGNNSAQAHLATGPINRLDSLFDRVFGDDGGFMDRAWAAIPVAMWEDDDHYSIEAELPGMSDEDVDVTVHNGMLLIRGERKPEGSRRYLCNDRSYGVFERSVSLPGAVTTDGVRAALVNGVLRIDLPKSPEARPRKITLNAT